MQNRSTHRSKPLPAPIRSRIATVAVGFLSAAGVCGCTTADGTTDPTLQNLLSGIASSLSTVFVGVAQSIANAAIGIVQPLLTAGSLALLF